LEKLFELYSKVASQQITKKPEAKRKTKEATA